MKINCLSCGHNVELDEAYADHYEGGIKCFGCGAMLEILTDQGALRFVRLPIGLLNTAQRPPSLNRAQGEAEVEHGAAAGTRIS